MQQYVLVFEEGRERGDVIEYLKRRIEKAGCIVQKFDQPQRMDCPLSSLM